MELNNTQKTVLIALAMVLISVVSFVLVNRYAAWEQCQNAQPTINRLSSAADSLAVSLVSMEKTLEDQSIDLEVKAALLEEKNDEIGYLKYQFTRFAKQQKTESADMVSLRKQLASARKQLHQAQQSFTQMRSSQGLLYRIQIGLLQEELLPPLPGGPDAFSVEEVQDVKKYIFGRFETHEDAKEFRDLFRKLGVADAWVVPYINAQRVDQQAAAAYLDQVPADENILSAR
ncbi:MAG: hypothetical protein AAFQ68_11215 [Bacteroidota bacterium]